jgi:L-malate glycosyltransferase
MAEKTTRKLKIAIVCHPSVGGSGAIATELGIWLAEQGHEIHFITHEMPFRLKSNYLENIFYHSVPLQQYDLFKYPPYTITLAVKIKEIAQWHDIDILHVHYAIPHAVSAFLAKEMLEGNLKIITTLHGTDVTLIGQDPSFKDLTTLAISKSDAVTTVSHSLKKDTLECLNVENPIQVIYNFVDTNKYKPEISCHHFHPKSENNEKIIVHVSNFRSLKRVEDVVKVFDKVQKTIPTRLFLIGEGESMSSVRNLCRSLDLCDKIEFLGIQDCTACILPRCDLFLLTSELESFGLAALEAMACGLPVVSTNAGGIPEVIDDGETGELYDIGDIDGLAQGVLKVLKNTKQYGEKAKIKAVENFNIDTIGQQYNELYFKTLDT